jgi:hypothetical protein
MRKFLGAGVLALAMVAGLVTLPAFGQEISRSIQFKRDAKIGGQVLPKGDYEVKYVEGKDELVIAQGNREILTATYKVTKLEKTPKVTSVFYSQETDGSYQLKRIEFKGKDTALAFENTVAKVVER